MTPNEIRKRAEKKYTEFLSNYLQDIPFQVYSWPVKMEYADLSTLGRALLENSKEKRGFGYTLHQTVRQTRSAGSQNIPIRVSIDTQEDFLKLIGKSSEFATFVGDAKVIRERIPALHEWMIKRPTEIVQFHDEWNKLLRVCEYFMTHPRPNLYMRELPIEIDTKYVERRATILRALLDVVLPIDAIQQNASDFDLRYGLRKQPKQIRFRLLDEKLLQALELPADDITIPLEQMWRSSKLSGQRCILVENQKTFLTLPTVENTFAIWSRGFAVTEMKHIPWLGSCSLYYWGDLDAQGFQILSALRSDYQYVTAILMDGNTFDAYQGFCVEGTPMITVPELPHLMPDETELYKYLATHNLRLEQEHIPHSAVIELFDRVFS